MNSFLLLNIILNIEKEFGPFQLLKLTMTNNNSNMKINKEAYIQVVYGTSAR